MATVVKDNKKSEEIKKIFLNSIRVKWAMMRGKEWGEFWKKTTKAASDKLWRTQILLVSLSWKKTFCETLSCFGSQIISENWNCSCLEEKLKSYQQRLMKLLENWEYENCQMVRREWHNEYGKQETCLKVNNSLAQILPKSKTWRSCICKNIRQ